MDSGKTNPQQNILEFYLIFEAKNLKTLLARNIPTIHSSIWKTPRPGHSPMLDPKKLRESMKLNLSTEVFLTLTLSLNFNPNAEDPLKFEFVSSCTEAAVLRQGRGQSDTRAPLNK